MALDQQELAVSKIILALGNAIVNSAAESAAC